MKLLASTVRGKIAEFGLTVVRGSLLGMPAWWAQEMFGRTVYRDQGFLIDGMIQRDDKQDPTGLHFLWHCPGNLNYAYRVLPLSGLRIESGKGLVIYD